MQLHVYDGDTSMRDPARIIPHWYMYPPKCSYSDCGSIGYEELPTLHQKTNLYVHVPFCNMKCNFCSLYTSSGYSESAADLYVDHLRREIDQFVQNFPLVRSPNLYFGGGTPALLSNRHLRAIMESLTPVFSDNPQSRSVEFSPDVVTDDSIGSWLEQGFDRASVGVQSFDDTRLAAMKRHHDGRDASQAIQALDLAGFRCVNVDLIFGDRTQTVEAWQRDINAVLASPADSCTFHPLSLVPKTAFDKKLDQQNVNADFVKDLHQIAIELFTSAGWKCTSAISFSRTGTPNPIEYAEANGIDTFGLGAGSRSYIGKLHISTLPSERKLAFGEVLRAYYDAVGRGQKPALSTVILNDEEITRRNLILSLHHGIVARGLFDLAMGYERDTEIRRQLENELEPSLNGRPGPSLRVRDAALPNVAALGLALASEGVRKDVNTTLRRVRL